jgi:hypothetical protein
MTLVERSSLWRFLTSGKLALESVPVGITVSGHDLPFPASDMLVRNPSGPEPVRILTLRSERGWRSGFQRCPDIRQAANELPKSAKSCRRGVINVHSYFGLDARAFRVLMFDRAQIDAVAVESGLRQSLGPASFPRPRSADMT